MTDLPEGWVPLSSYDRRENKKSGGPTGDYQRLIKAVNAKQISSRKIRGMASQLVRQDEAEYFLKKCDEKAQAKSLRSPAVHADDDQFFRLHAILSRISLSAERIAVALENIATTPKSTEDQGDETN